MKKFSRFFSVVVVALVVMSMFACTAFAANPSIEDLQKSVVMIVSEFSVSSANYEDVSISMTLHGTGFAVGEPGKPVQYIATCNHCVYEPSGVYTLIFDKNSDIVDFIPQEDGTAYPEKFKKNGCTYVVDYFNISLEESRAVFSMASGDFTSLSVIDSDISSDVALCKLASEPTTKIQARALKKHEDVSVGDVVFAIGYPTTSDYVNDEGKYDYKDSTVTKGIISKSQLTYGIATKERQFYTYQIDAEITFGNSGGPLFAEDGSIIGINSFGHMEADAVSKASYSTTIDELIKLLDRSSVPYKLAGEINFVLIAIIALFILSILAVPVIIIIVLKNKKKGKEPDMSNVPARVYVQEGVPRNQQPPAAPSSGKYYLLGIKGVFEGKKYSIDSRVVIGRNREKCNVVFPDNQPGISGVHCEIIKTGSILTLKDCESTYGTFLSNGAKVAPNLPVVLKSGERFWVGDKENVFEVRY